MSDIDEETHWDAATKTLRKLVGHERACPRHAAWWGDGDSIGDCTCPGRPLLCDRVHLIGMESSLLESELTAVIARALDGGSFDDYTTDYYDNSIEVYGARDGRGPERAGWRRSNVWPASRWSGRHPVTWR